MIALIGVFVTVEYDVKVWYYDQTDADRTALRSISRAETDRLYRVQHTPLS